MSYWVYVTQNNQNLLDLNMTSNVAEMWCAAGVDLRELDGAVGAVAAPQLADAVRTMLLDPVRFEGMEPANGWGSYEGCLKFLGKFAIACARWPEGHVRVSY